jgi:hypothetical protein
LSTAEARPSAALLRKLSDEFEACMHGLHLVREGWQQFTQTAPGGRGGASDN